MPTPDTKNGKPYNLHDSYAEHAAILDKARVVLTVLSDGPVKWEHGRGLSGVARVPTAVLPHVWSSAHEAAAGIAELGLRLLPRALELMSDPPKKSKEKVLAKQVVENTGKALAISLDEEATLYQRIRRERAKLVAQYQMPQSSRIQNGSDTQVDGQSDELPWSPDALDELAPLPRRLLKHMHGRERDTITNVSHEVWGSDQVRDDTINVAISRVNTFLQQQREQKVLSKLRGEGVIAWK
jgi:hypothetical protein